jgi:hypothetical protein
MTLYEQTMQAMLSRLQGAPPLVGNIRRSHKVIIPRGDAPAVYLAESDDEPVDRAGNCDTQRRFEPVVRVFVRDDDGYATMDAIVADVVARLDPQTQGGAAYPAGVRLELVRLAVDEDIADADVLRRDVHIAATYTAGYWTLDAPAT